MSKSPGWYFDESFVYHWSDGETDDDPCVAPVGSTVGPAAGRPSVQGPDSSDADEASADEAVPIASGRSRSFGTALLLAVLLGPTGAHHFYLGRRNAGVATLLLTGATLAAPTRAARVVFAVLLVLWLAVDLLLLPTRVLRASEPRPDA